AEREYRTLVERLPVVVYSAQPGAEGRWSYVSPQIEKLVGFTPEEWMADSDLWISRVHPDDRERVLEAEDRCENHGLQLEVEYRMLARDGRLVWVRDEAKVRSAEGGAFEIEGLLIDISDQRAASEELRFHANHDQLTGLFNRRRFEDELKGREGQRGAVIAVGVDHLKLVNDSLGPSAGDAVLRGITKAIDRMLTPGELLARLGGDEFAVLVPDASDGAGRDRALAILDAIRSHRTSMPVTASAGVAPFEPGDSLRAEDALMTADIALHQAKEQGRDRVVVFAGRQDERLAWVGRVRSAIREERLVLHAQPILDVRTGDLVSEELLVRMLGDGDEVIPPGSFLPTAERFGLIRDIDTWVVRQALALGAKGRSVNINLSARSVADAELPARLERDLADAGADPSRVVFEITET
ncbi:MAG: diguanylate cyclase domain-containing protein, partial [Thermoleophilaceae bacterium]